MKLLIVDAHVLIREGLAALFHKSWPDTAIVQAQDAAEGLAIADTHRDLDAVLLDLGPPGRGGIAVIVEFGRRCPGLPIMVLSVSDDPVEARRALASGASGYLSKSASSKLLFSALQFMLQGNVYVPPLLIDAAGLAPDRVQPPDRCDEVCRLTPRQTAVLKLLGEGLSNKAIAQTLKLRDQTVKAHITAVFKTLGVVNRTQAATAARRAGLIREGNPP